MKRTIVDFTTMRKGTHTGDGAQIEVCSACLRKGSATRVHVRFATTTVTVLHTVSVRSVLGVQVASVDECVTLEPVMPIEKLRDGIVVVGEGFKLVGGAEGEIINNAVQP